MTIQEVIKYITWYATRHDVTLSTNRLVKFMYLFDYFHAKMTGKKFSDLPWTFVYYGPYCTRAMENIDQTVKVGDICKSTFDSKFDIEKKYHLFHCRDDQDAEKIEEEMNIFVLSKLQWAITEFGDDTADLLDYVYFDTEPMKNARKGDVLDFTLVERFKPPKIAKRRKLSQEEIQKAKALISQMGAKYEEGAKQITAENARIGKFKNDSFRQLVQFLDHADPLPEFTGTARIELP